MQYATPGRPVANPEQIERELVRVWRDAAEGDAKKDAGDPAPRMRAVLSNLIVLSAHDTSRKVIDDLITELCISHPSRFFLVSLGADSAGGSASPLHTSVSSRCVLASSGAHVCSEEVYISAEFRAATLVPNLLTSLFVADVPVTLLVLCDPNLLVDASADVTVRHAGEAAIRHLLSGLSKLCDRMIYDSAFFSDYAADLEDLIFFGKLLSQDPTTGRAEAALDVGGKNFILLRDIGWRRLRRWRMLLAEQFSNRRFRDVERRITALEITCSAPPGDGATVPSEVLLFAAWFAGSLRWQFVQMTPTVNEPGLFVALFATPEKETRRVEFRLTGRTGKLRGLQAVRVLVDDQEISEIRIERVEGDDSFTLFSGAGSALHSRRAPAMEEPFERLILNDVVGGRGDEDFARVLIDSLELARHLGERKGS